MSREIILSKGSLVGFVTGGIVGAVVALLYAPKSGKRLRYDIMAKAEGYRSDAEKHLDMAKDKALEILSDGQKKGEKLITDAKEKADELLKDAEKIFDKIK